MRKLALIIGLVTFVAWSTGFAQETEEKDFLEATIHGGLASPTGAVTNWSDTLGAKSGFLAGVEVGYFLTPSIVLGVDLSYYQLGIDATDAASDRHHRYYNIALYGKYYFFSESRFAPYLKAQAGVDNAKFTTSVRDNNGGDPKYRDMSYDPAFAIGAAAGAFYYTSDVSGFYVEAGLHQGFTKNAKGTYQASSYKFGESTSMFELRGGIALFFGSNK